MGIASQSSACVLVLAIVLAATGIVSGCNSPGSGSNLSLGDELIRLKEAHNRDAITDFEWEGAKRRLISAHSRVPNHSLGGELISLKEAHGRDAITDFEWEGAKRKLIDVYSAR